MVNECVVIVIQPRFVSMYWYGHILVEYLDKFLYQYTEKVKISALGVAVYDDDIFLIHAVRNTGQKVIVECKGFYWFAQNDYAEVLMELNINGEMDTAYSYGNERITNEI